MRRRDFLRHAGCFVASASAAGLLACGDDDDGEARADAGMHGGKDGGKPEPDDRSFSFPHGVASGDPRPSSVMLWTRVAFEQGKDAPVALALEVATDADFRETVLNIETLKADARSDYTIRVLVEDLEPDTIYYYRFRAGDAASTVGRSWTAPRPDAEVPVRFAWASCQDYTAGFYGAYRTMINDDQAADAAEQLRFVLHVGDFIYETRGEGFQVGLDDDLNTVELKDKSGEPRVVPPFPSGGGGMGATGGTFAETLEDYRHLYKTFLSDPDLQAARARWPFVCTWDDHEFSDDCWQTQANYTRDLSFDEPSQPRRLNASQAWFEFVPAILDEAEAADGVEPAAQDFKGAKVNVAPYDEPIEVDEPNNMATLGAITIYRRLRFGKHVDLIITDGRSYRSDHALLEEATKDNPLVFHPRAGLPLAVVNTLDAGKTADGGSPPDMAGPYENSRKASPPGTLLGPEQKAWFKKALKASTATFKVWGNPVPLLRLRLDTTDVTLFQGGGDLLLSADGWDGYPSERAELTKFIKANAIANVVSLSGDHHGHFVGLVHDDYDGASPTPVMADFCAAGISSSSQFSSVANAVKTAVPPDLADVVEPVLKLIVYDATALGGEGKAKPNLNTLIRWGSAAATTAAMTNDLAMAEAARRASVNEHLRYVDSAANGYGLAVFDGDGAKVTLVTIDRPLHDTGEDGVAVRGKAEFVLPRVDGDEAPTLDEPELSGQKPFPLS